MYWFDLEGFRLPCTTISSEFEFPALSIEADFLKQKFEIKKEHEIQILVRSWCITVLLSCGWLEKNLQAMFTKEQSFWFA